MFSNRSACFPLPPPVLSKIQKNNVRIVDIQKYPHKNKQLLTKNLPCRSINSVTPHFPTVFVALLYLDGRATKAFLSVVALNEANTDKTKMILLPPNHNLLGCL